MEIRDELVREDKFPGNRAALLGLLDVFEQKTLLALTGAGSSAPLAPTWTMLLKTLLNNGVDEGFIPKNDQGFLYSQIADDPLELASTLEEFYTRQRFRSRLSDIFSLNDRHTEIHSTLVQLPLSGIITLNYDDGLSTAYVKRKGLMPRIIRAEDKYEINKWLNGSPLINNQFPILHWHGNVSSPETMVLTADDYSQFYSRKENASFIEEVWRTKNLIIVGFGFKDPFLTRIAESVLRNIDADNQHYALIGIRDTEGVSEVLRRQFARKFRLTPIFYQVDCSGEKEDHVALVDLLQFLRAKADSKAQTSAQPSAATVPDQDSRESAVERAKREFESGLFVGASGSPIYVEPTLSRPTVVGDGEQSGSIDQVSIAEVIQCAASFIITAPWEYGGTTLGRRIVYDCLAAGDQAFLRDAHALPKYAKKLREDSAFSPRTDEARKILVLDNASFPRDERVVKEIIGMNSFHRLLVLNKTTESGASSVDDIELGDEFVHVSLHQLQRCDIRTIASALYDTFDGDLISGAVEKTYNDLLELCIPLTPSNVLMYLSVLYKEGDFVPLNRLHIMDQYIRSLLYRPSDSYRDTFNADHKIDVLSSFVFHLYEGRKNTFTEQDWNTFAESEMERSLTAFDKGELLRDLVGSRFIAMRFGAYHFKYKLFYAYFLGQYISQRPDVLRQFIANGDHIAVDGLVEIIAGLSKDNKGLMLDLLERAESSISDFENQYKTASLDPYSQIKWAPSDNEQEELWRPVAKQLATGPSTGAEVDKLKRSIVAEQRTSDQMVIIREFSHIERSVSFNQKLLISALRESRDLDGDLKLKAMSVIYHGYKIVMQIGFLFSPIIASRRYFVWNNVAFVNNLNYDDAAREDHERQTRLVAGAIPPAVSGRAADEIGSKRLGQIFKYQASKDSLKNFESYLNFVALIRAKPEGWEESARAIMDSTDRQDLYLKYMFLALMDQFGDEVNTIGERSALKRLVGNVQAKRELKAAKPTNKMITNMLRYLEKENYFNDKAKG